MQKKAEHENLAQASGRFNVLVVDDDESIRNLIHSKITRAGYACSTAANADEALSFLEAKSADVMITDIIMPGLNGIELMKAVKKKWNTDVILMTGYINDFSYEKVVEEGANDFIEKPVNLHELLIRLRRVLKVRALFVERSQIEEELKQSLVKLRDVMEATVQAMALAIEERDSYTAGHQKRVSALACAMAEQLGLAQDEIEGIRVAGIIHDLGKIAVPTELLVKPSRLNEFEFGLIRMHPQVGYNILKNIDFPWPVAQIVLQHHERLDGSGYPNGLSENSILPEAKILAVADVIEAIASHRPYRPALGIDVALEEISTKSGILYDPDAVKSALTLFEKKEFTFETPPLQNQII